MITPYMAILASSLVYSEKSRLEIEAKFIRLLPLGISARWQVWENPRHDVSGFHALAYYNREDRELLIAFRGTVASWGNIAADVDIFRQKCLAYIHIANRYVNHLVRNVCHHEGIVEADLTLHMTGHSLGGAIAICAGALRNTPVYAFEPPGVLEILQNINAHDLAYMGYQNLPPGELVRRATENTISYLAAPDPVNTCNHQVGNLRRIYIDHVARQGRQIKEKDIQFLRGMLAHVVEFFTLSPWVAAGHASVTLLSAWFSNSVEGMVQYVARQHSSKNILACFDHDLGEPILATCIEQWPSTQEFLTWSLHHQIGEFFTLSSESEHRPLTVNRDMEKKIYLLPNFRITQFYLSPDLSDLEVDTYRRICRLMEQHFDEFFEDDALREELMRRLGYRFDEPRPIEVIQPRGESQMNWWSVLKWGGLIVLIGCGVGAAVVACGIPAAVAAATEAAVVAGVTAAEAAAAGAAVATAANWTILSCVGGMVAGGAAAVAGQHMESKNSPEIAALEARVEQLATQQQRLEEARGEAIAQNRNLLDQAITQVITRVRQLLRERLGQHPDFAGLDFDSIMIDPQEIRGRLLTIDPPRPPEALEAIAEALSQRIHEGLRIIVLERRQGEQAQRLQEETQNRERDTAQHQARMQAMQDEHDELRVNFDLDQQRRQREMNELRRLVFGLASGHLNPAALMGHSDDQVGLGDPSVPIAIAPNPALAAIAVPTVEVPMLPANQAELMWEAEQAPALAVHGTFPSPRVEEDDDIIMQNAASASSRGNI